ncbi:MAG: SHD1 domain-containing protein [Thermoguttaceae bacterium]|jgi:hypothetical protein|nr:SHD1 domain-containing protein [Thermoguttaceae bacterium]
MKMRYCLVVLGFLGALAVAGLAVAQEQPVATEPANADSAAVDPGKLMPPRSPTGWYSSAEMNHASQAAVMLGQPLVVMLTDPESTCPKCQAQTKEWMQARELGFFVRVLVSTKDTNRPPLLSTLQQLGGEKAGRFIPQLYFGTPTGQLLGAVPYGVERVQFVNAVGMALTEFGGVIPPDQMAAMWKRLSQARQLWSDGKFTPALRAYQEIKRAEGTNPNLAIFQELKQDEQQILEKGEEELAAVRELLASGDPRKGRTELADIRRRYAGFQPADDAKQLQEAKPAETARNAAEADAADSSDVRSWTDATGKHHIEAELIAVKDGWVRLKRTSGDLVSVPVARLSQADQKYVAQGQRR